MQLNYLLPARFPTEKAYGHQIASMARAYASIGVDFCLWRSFPRGDAADARATYALAEDELTLETLGPIAWMQAPLLPARVRFTLQSLQFFLVFLLRQFPRGSVMYTRLPTLAALAALKGHPVVCECHDWFSSWAGVRVWLAKQGSGVVTTNPLIRDAFIEQGFPAERLLVAPNGVDRSIFDLDLSKEEALIQLPLDENDRARLRSHTVLMYTGSYKTMGVEKGIADSIRALAQLDGCDLLFVAVGGKPGEIQEYESLARECGVADSVLLLGRYDQSTLALFQQAADVMLMPFPDRAHYREHMSPLKTFEYLCSKRPIIASTLPSLQAILSEETAFWCAPDDPTSLATAVRAVLADPAEATRRAEAAYAQVDAYTWDARARAITSFIKGHIPAP